MEKTSVLFVCLGNICRSPMAEGHFIDHITRAGLKDRFRVDSAGTNGLHDGARVDSRMRKTALKHGIELVTLSRKIRNEDFFEFDHIVAMDQKNLATLKAMQDRLSGTKAKLHLMRDYDPGNEGKGVPDPYYGGMSGFEEVFQILEVSTANFLRSIQG